MWGWGEYTGWRLPRVRAMGPRVPYRRENKIDRGTGDYKTLTRGRLGSTAITAKEIRWVNLRLKEQRR
jgi:hypothetical protein